MSRFVMCVYLMGDYATNKSDHPEESSYVENIRF